MNLCILFYPGDGEQAEVSFVNYTLLQTSTDSDDQEVCKAINRALLDPDGISSVSEDAVCDRTTMGNIYPPCQIDRQITLYF